MTWMIIRLVLSLAFIAAVLLFAARVAKKRGLGQGNGLIEVVARQRMGRASSVNVVRIGDVVLVVGATEEQVTLLAEVDLETIDAVLEPAHDEAEDDEPVERRPALAARSASPSSPALAGSVFDKNGWGSLVNQMRERTVRRS
jgi:flagellar protein FliO/FliZ